MLVFTQNSGKQESIQARGTFMISVLHFFFTAGLQRIKTLFL
jgi:hypothetical protein